MRKKLYVRTKIFKTIFFSYIYIYLTISLKKYGKNEKTTWTKLRKKYEKNDKKHLYTVKFSKRW